MNTDKNFSSLKNEGVENVSNQERRNFLKMGLAITGIFAGGSMLSVASTFNRAHASDFAKKYPYKPHYSMVMQQHRCIDCERCMEACVATNNVPNRPGNYRTTILEKETPDAIGGKLEFIPVLCNQCNLPQCTRVCPTKATYKDKTTGIVLMDTKKCIGCLTCQLGCPYNARYFDEKNRHAVDKCDFCWGTRISKGEKDTACALACPADVRIFGDLSNQEERVFKIVHQIERPVWVLRPESGTRPNVFYTKG
ncbi:MAG: 4Fe-4S dicluster domain-containing protein [Desulfuromonadaceae bacterium]